MSKYERSEVEAVEWDDVAGLADAKAALREAIEWPVKYAELYKRYGKRPSRGVLLYGPPGCGKTMLGKAAACALRRLHPKPEKKIEVKVNGNPMEMLMGFDGLFGLAPKKSESGFFYVKGPEILNCYIGESERAMRSIFDDARAFKKERGYPAVVFIDEAEAILSHRGSSRNAASVVVPMFLAEMDGFDDAGCFMILATNRPDDLDPAVVRAGRIDRKIRIPRPDEAQAVEVFRAHLRTRLSGVDPARCARELYASHRELYRIAYQSGRTASVSLGDLMSGAAIATLVDRACEAAIARDISVGGGAEPSGVGPADVTWAIEQTEQEHRATNHFDDLLRIVEESGEVVATVRKASRDGTFSDVSLAPTGAGQKQRALA